MSYFSVWMMSEKFADGNNWGLSFAVDVYSRDVVRMRISEEKAREIIVKMELVEMLGSGIWVSRE